MWTWRSKAPTTSARAGSLGTCGTVAWWGRVEETVVSVMASEMLLTILMLIWLTRLYAKFGVAFTLSRGRRAMNRFARSAALAGAALVALVLAIAASATNAKSDRSAAPSAGAAVTNYVTYVKGKRGKADPKKSKVYIGWVNQQGGQVVIGGLATAGAQLAVRYVNDVLGGVGGHPVVLIQCFIKSNEEEGTTCGQKLVNDKRI